MTVTDYVCTSLLEDELQDELHWIALKAHQAHHSTTSQYFLNTYHLLNFDGTLIPITGTIRYEKGGENTIALPAHHITLCIITLLPVRGGNTIALPAQCMYYIPSSTNPSRGGGSHIYTVNNIQTALSVTKADKQVRITVHEYIPGNWTHKTAPMIFAPCSILPG